MRKTVVVLTTVAILAAAGSPPADGAVGSGRSGSYRLAKGAKQCRNGYVRQIRKVGKHRQVWCMVLTETRLDTTTDPLLLSSGMVWTVSGGIFYGPGNGGAGKELRGQRITYTIKDETTRKTLGSFVGTSNSEAKCTIVSTMDASGTIETLAGQAVLGSAACLLSPVSLPAADLAGITGRFAGTSKYAGSVSFEVAI
jgi:hypothetical protein